MNRKSVRHLGKPWAVLPILLLFVLLTACATAPGGGSGVIGPIEIGQPATGTLVAKATVAAWHTYILTVAAGTDSITIRMDADADLDMAAKFGSEIQSYNPTTGDWDFIDRTTANSAEFVLINPQAGEWYIDVFNILATGTSGTYTLLVTSQ